MKIMTINELQNSLGSSFEAVRNGETLVITQGDEILARIVPPPANFRWDHPFAEMALRGEARLGHERADDEKKRIYGQPRPPLLQGITSAEILDALREEDDRGI